MRNFKLAILDNNEETLREYREYFTSAKGCDVIGVTNDGAEGIKFILDDKPDIVIMNLTLQTIDGFGVLDEVHKKVPEVDFIVTGSFTDDEVIRRVMTRGAQYYLLKPVTPEIIETRVREIVAEHDLSEGGEVRETRHIASIEEKISSIFMAIGIPPHIRGYHFLRDGIKMAVEKPAIINNVTKILYPRIAAMYETTPSKVERAIRHAIEVAWNRGRVDAITAVFGVRVYIGTEKPTNSEFIALVADKLILESYQ